MQKSSYIFLLLPLLGGCKKFVSLDPPTTRLVTAAVFTDNNTADASVQGIYAQMLGSSGGFAKGGNQGISLLAGLAADELTSYSVNPNLNQFYKNGLLATNTTLQNALWNSPYASIYACNAVLEGLASSLGLDSAKRIQWKGEALFVRSFCFFYLYNMFGKIPLPVTTDYTVNATLPRADSSSVYQQIIRDLQTAITYLPAAYPDGMRVRATKAAAQALLARVSLFAKDYPTALAQSAAVMGNPNFVLEDLDNVFLAGSQEAIWQLLPVQAGYNTLDGNIFILTTRPNLCTLSDALLNAFESGDQRQAAWTGQWVQGSNTWTYAYKYKVKTGTDLLEYSVVLRLAEQMLIHSEAAAASGNLPAAVNDLNLIRRRAGLTDYNGPLQKDSILTAILQERRVELFCEWGHRWFDLKRTGLIDKIVSASSVAKGTSWVSTAALWPIPERELSANPRLVQNPGY
jgi:hypothetical protein